MTEAERVELALRRAADIMDKKNIGSLGDACRIIADELAKLPKVSGSSK